MSIYLIVAIVMGLNGLVMVSLSVLGGSALMERHRVREDKARRVPSKEHARNRAINSLVSTVQIFGACYLLKDQLFVYADQSVGRVLLEAGLMLALYDFGYYLLHRFMFHQWSVGKKMHGVHHRIRTPYVNDSLFIHPMETVLGLSLFLGCVLLIGPVHPYAFALGFFVYSVWNLLIHSAFHLPFFPFKAVSVIVTHHDVHHQSMKAGYYSSLTPTFDVLFGTATDNTSRQREP
jgi:sterol desaturase/sphingolipid hydroxylase (fatty acid hydroxylase superfamily)